LGAKIKCPGAKKKKRNKKKRERKGLKRRRKKIDHGLGPENRKKNGLGKKKK
jgi:hypothetical protein